MEGSLRVAGTKHGHPLHSWPSFFALIVSHPSWRKQDNVRAVDLCHLHVFTCTNTILVVFFLDDVLLKYFETFQKFAGCLDTGRCLIPCQL